MRWLITIFRWSSTTGYFLSALWAEYVKLCDWGQYDKLNMINVTIKTLLLVFCCCAFSLLTGCNKNNQSRQIVAAPTRVASPAKATGCGPDALRQQMEQSAAQASGRVGAAVLLVETGEAVALNGEQRFPMQSVYKVPIAMLVLHQVDNGKLSLEQKVKVEPKDFVSFREFTIQGQFPQGAELTVKEILRFMISESDGTACDVLMRLVGGPHEVTKFLRDQNIQDIVVANYEREMAGDQSLPAQNWTTPVAMTQLLKILQEGRGISADNRTLLLELMRTSRPGRKRLKGLLPPNTDVAHKTGSGRTVDGIASATNDVGLVTLPDGRHLSIAVFVADSKANEPKREATIAALARAGWDCWVAR
jgi:beta-lactamase class A